MSSDFPDFSGWREENERVMRNRKLRRERLAAARALATHTPEEWFRLCREFSGCCVFCGKESDLTKDHITPVYQGGSDGIDNIQPACSPCNARKGSDSFNWAQFWREHPLTWSAFLSEAAN